MNYKVGYRKRSTGWMCDRMNAADYDAVVFDGDIYCIGCLPDGVNVESDDVHPIFADNECDHALVCCVCGTEHDYMRLLDAVV